MFSIPFAFFMGPQRAGTSWIYRYFMAREDICLPRAVKEIFFFDQNFNKGPEFYFSHFQQLPEHKIAMEITATSFDHPEAPKRVYEILGRHIKLICPLRHPVERSWSLYNHFLRYGIVEGSLEEAIAKMPYIIETSRYAQHIQRWVDIFGPNSIYFCFQEDMARDQEAYVRNLCNALGIAYNGIPMELSGRYNAATKTPSAFIASVAQKAAESMRARGIYSVINLAKALGLKKYIFGDEKPDTENQPIPKQQRFLLERLLNKEIEKLETLIGQPVSSWK